MVLISSICGVAASTGFAAYNASKHGVIGLMRTLAHELGPDGITVNAVCPGWVDTPMLAASIEDAGADAGPLRLRGDEPDRAPDRTRGGHGDRRLAHLAECRRRDRFVLPVDLGLEKRAWP
jgi:NAD(P)-dependent dehydrogenase (short-subunit alcohol dehydrogenase family)